MSRQSKREAERRKSADAIQRMNEALRLMDASVNELRTVASALRSGEIEIVDGEDENDDE